MRIIEALKKIKYNRSKINDLTGLIAGLSAHMESETHLYPDAAKRVKEYQQSVWDTMKETNDLLLAVQRTNSHHKVTVEIGGVAVTKTITEWIFRRREGIQMENLALRALTDRRLKPTTIKNADGDVALDKPVLHFDPAKRDEKMLALSNEIQLIDSALEIANATLDLID